MSDAFEIPAPELTTPRLRLRPLTVEDAPAIFAYASDPEVARFTLWPPHKSLDFTKGFLRLFTQPAFLSWAIVPQGSEEVIGMIFLHSWSKHHRKAEVAFNLARSHWKQGLVTEASARVLSFAFRDLKLNRIEATCMPAHQAARRVLEKAGLVHEGRMRQSQFRYDGAHDMDLFSALAADATAAEMNKFLQA
jgi:ribosomal-protein-alanine N-acetyltransferase